jgi:hypothetical protein
MATQDTACTIVPYFKIHPGKALDFRMLAERCIEQAGKEHGCLYYGFTFNGDQAHCREGYRDGESVLAHVQNIRPLLVEGLKIADMTRLEIHGPETELAKVRAALADLKPQYFTLEYGFRR